MLGLWGAWLLWAAPSAEASKQRKFEVDERRQEAAFDIAWTDVSGTRHTVAFALPREAVDADRTERTFFPRKEFNEAVVADVLAYGRTVKGVKITAEAKKGQIHVGASGDKTKARAAFKEALQVRDRSMDQWIANSDFFRRGDGLSFDHAKLVDDYTEAVRPVAQALGAGTMDARAFATHALHFVQAIPYEAVKKNGGDPGYRRPLALLYRNRGDCDSKAVLYLALVRAAHPEVPMSVVYIPGHALVGLGLPPKAGESTFKHKDVQYIHVEPVGPAMVPLGKPAPSSKKALRQSDVHAVPAAR